MWRSVRVWHQQFILKIWCMRFFWFKRLIHTNCQVKYVLLPCWAWDGFSFNSILHISISKVIYTRFKISKKMNELIIEYVWRTHILILFPECSKAVTYDERPKMKRDTAQKLLCLHCYVDHRFWSDRSLDSILRTVVHTVRELQLWTKEIERRHPSTKGSYCVQLARL